MAKNKKQRFEGVVYSTDTDFSYQLADDMREIDTLSNDRQKLKVVLDKKARKGKVVTLVEGFVGSEKDLQELAKILKQKCGVGGSAKDGEILIQGDFKQRVFDYLKTSGYGVRLL
ncbi:translation initiation factor [Sphingobacterium sp. SGG-5]|uniref:translation initiation factor n=1 Tax=Sphingobacterium sp. SGG-5 TaxID=2710881 RepID=UPI0013EAB7BB|nr:translation initiation factor [Sphingobacterium sp. SGG-5]NGM60973.1 translation initiation factor [Sphingobacterium sp. SGG-5]